MEAAAAPHEPSARRQQAQHHEHRARLPQRPLNSASLITSAAARAAGMRSLQRCRGALALLALLGLLASSADALAWRLFAGRWGRGREAGGFDGGDGTGSAGHAPGPAASLCKSEADSHVLWPSGTGDGRGARPPTAGGCGAPAACPCAVSIEGWAPASRMIGWHSLPAMQGGVHHRLYARLPGGAWQGKAAFSLRGGEATTAPQPQRARKQGAAAPAGAPPQHNET